MVSRSFTTSMLLMVCIMINLNAAYPLDDSEYDLKLFNNGHLSKQLQQEELDNHHRYVRSLQPGAPKFPIPGRKNNVGWQIDSSLSEQFDNHYRYVRSLQPGAPNFPIPGQNNNGGWQVDPSLSKGQDGNTRGSINVQHSGPNHRVNAQVDKVLRGPGRSKPTYSVHGSWKW